MNFVDQLKEHEKRVQVKKPKYNDFLNFGLKNALGVCYSRPDHCLKGYYYCKAGEWDCNDDFGFKSDCNDPTTHIRNHVGGLSPDEVEDILKFDILTFQREIYERLAEEGFNVHEVKVTKHNKYIDVENGYGMFGRKLYKKVSVDYLLIYIHITW